MDGLHGNVSLHRSHAVRLTAFSRAYVERVIGTIRRECLDHMIVFNERCLHRHLQNFVN
jgi:hypothetical protein